VETLWIDVQNSCSRIFFLAQLTLFTGLRNCGQLCRDQPIDGKAVRVIILSTMTAGTLARNTCPAVRN
jgi:hypothetical protein